MGGTSVLESLKFMNEYQLLLLLLLLPIQGMKGLRYFQEGEGTGLFSEHTHAPLIRRDRVGGTLPLLTFTFYILRNHL